MAPRHGPTHKQQTQKRCTLRSCKSCAGVGLPTRTGLSTRTVAAPIIFAALILGLSIHKWLEPLCAGVCGDGLLRMGLPTRTVRRLAQGVAFLVPTAFLVAAMQVGGVPVFFAFLFF